MSNLSFDDVHRSLRRYVAAALGVTWSVRTQREVIGDDERPAAVVEASAAALPAPGNPGPRRTVPQGDYAVMQPYAVTAYPAIFDTAAEGRHESLRVAQLLYDGIAHGLVNDDGSELGRPMAVPVWDYDGVPVVDPTNTGLRAGAANPYAWAWVDQHSARALQDPLDATRWTVAVDVRLSWQRSGRIADPNAAKLAAGGVAGTWKGERVR